MLNGSAGGSLPAPEPSASVGAKAGWRRRAEPSASPGDAPKRPLPPGDAPKRTGARPRDGGRGDGGIGRPRGASRPAGDTPKNLFLLFIAGLTVQSFIAHALARLSPPKKNKKAYVTDALLRYA